MWFRGSYKEHGNDEFPKGGKPEGGYWEEEVERRYERGISGYNLLTHFQCDQCYFRNIQGRDPDALSKKDMRLLAKIRRATLDTFWSRESGTVKGNLTIVKRLGKVESDELRMETWLPPMVP